MNSVVSGSGFKVWIVPTSSLSGDHRLKLVRLPNPGSGEDTWYAVDAGDPEKGVFEVQVLDEDIGAWVLDNREISGAESSGSFVILTPTDPVFLVLPFLKSAKKTVPLDHLLADHSGFDDLLPALIQRLPKTADAIGAPDLNVFKYNEAKTLLFLQRKVKRVHRCLLDRRQTIKVDGHSSDIMSGSRQDDDAYLRLAFDIVSEYIDPDTAKLLHQRLGLVDVQPPVQQPAKKARKSAEPADDAALHEVNDYSNSVKTAGPDKTKLTAKQKALAKASVGTRGISSFFTKK